jgi:hypothetical protein
LSPQKAKELNAFMKSTFGETKTVLFKSDFKVDDAEIESTLKGYLPSEREV